MTYTAFSVIKTDRSRDVYGLLTSLAAKLLHAPDLSPYERDVREITISALGGNDLSIEALVDHMGLYLKVLPGTLIVSANSEGSHSNLDLAEFLARSLAPLMLTERTSFIQTVFDPEGQDEGFSSARALLKDGSLVELFK